MHSQTTDTRSHIFGEALDLFHTPEQVAYATLPVNGHWETWALRGQEFRRLLRHQYHKKYSATLSAAMIAETIYRLEGQALFEGLELPVHLRLAALEDCIYLDLVNPAWEVVVITAAGWDVVHDSPVKFRRTSAMRSLPYPLHGGSIEALRPLVNIGSDQDWRLLVSFLVSTFRPCGPYPVLMLHGSQGAAKSTLTRMLRALIDPNQAPIRTLPRTERDLFISARQGWILAFDNLSALSIEASDALCRLTTGGSVVTRKLYTDADEAIFQATRPVILNGIEEIVTRWDLLDRSILLHLPTLSPAQRRDEVQLWREFDHARPRILGAVLDAVSGAVRDLGTVTLAERPRMADFAYWSCAAAPALGWTVEQFLDAYSHNIQAARDLVMESSLLAQAVLKLLVSQDAWEGTATELLEVLQPSLEGIPRQERLQSPQTLANALRRLEPALAAVGVQVTFHRQPGGNRTRLIMLERVVQQDTMSR